MNFRKILYIVVLAAVALSCEKEEEYTSLPSLEGMLRIYGLPEFLSPGQQVTLTHSQVKNPDGGEVGYCWKVTPTQSKYDTLDVFTHTFSDTLKTYSVYCSAFSTGYSSLSAVSYTTVVKPGYNGSIRGVNYKSIAEDSVFVRHMPYYYKQIGNQTWTLNNMAVRSGIPFRNAEVMSEVFGRYYNFSEAKAACDSLDRDGQNWELPSMKDWAILENHISGMTGEGKAYGKSFAAAALANAYFNDKLMVEYWPEVGDITNGSGFSALSAGYANMVANSFNGEFEYAAFWTSDEATSTEGYYKYITYDQPGLSTGKGNKESFGASVRCIRK